MKFLIALVIASLLGSVAWGLLLDRHKRPYRVTEKAFAVDSTWYQTLPMNADSATQKYLERIPPAASAPGELNGNGLHRATALEFLTTIATLTLLLFSNAIVTMKKLAERLSGRPNIQVALIALQTFLAYSLLKLPGDIYVSFVLPWYTGNVAGSFLGWTFESLMIQRGVSSLLFVLGALAIFATFRRWPTKWVVTLVSIGAFWVTFSTVVWPSVSDRYVEELAPLPNGAKRDMILKFARENDIPVAQVVLQNVGQYNDDLNAAVTGVGNYALISIDESMIQALSDDELRAILAHEFAHFKQHHVVKGLVFDIALLSLMVIGIAWLTAKFVEKFGARWGVSDATSIGALPVLWGFFLIGRLVLTPIESTYGRAQEAAADRYALDVTKLPFATADFHLRALSVVEVHPSAIDEFIFFDHPSVYTRVHSAMEWRAAHQVTQH